MTKFSLILILSFALISLQCFANESNLDNFNYPSHNCGDKVKKPKNQPELHHLSVLINITLPLLSTILKFQHTTKI